MKELLRQLKVENHIVHFLSPYSSDFNSIELTFSILKAWIQRHYHFLQSAHAIFGDFLQQAIVQSRCDRFARQQFQHAAGEVYITQKELDRMRRQLAAYECGDIDEIESEDEGN